MFVQLDKAAKAHKQVTGKQCDQVVLARTLYAMADDKTTEHIDKEERVNVEDPGSYATMKDWFGTQWEKGAGRTLVRGHRHSNKINIGAIGQNSQESAAQPSAAATAAAILADPWSGSDPWSAGECLPCTEQADGCGVSLGALDAFGKAKGKGKTKPPLACRTCLGIGYPASLCALAPGSGETELSSVQCVPRLRTHGEGRCF